MDLCAERMAALNMYVNSGQRVIKRMITFRDRPPYEGGSGMPCDACREFLLQFSWENRNLEIMTDYGRRETVTLGELMPVCLSGVHTLREKVCIVGVKWIFYNQLFKWTFLGEI